MNVMANKEYRYSLAPRDKKLAGVAAKAGELTGIDATFIRIALILSFLFVSWEMTVIAYVAAGILLSVERKREVEGRPSLFHRKPPHERGMGRLGSGKRQRSGSVHDARTKLDDTDRRMMAIDHHLNSADTEKLDREIAELRAKIAADRKAKEAGEDAADKKEQSDG